MKKVIGDKVQGRILGLDDQVRLEDETIKREEVKELINQNTGRIMNVATEIIKNYDKSSDREQCYKPKAKNLQGMMGIDPEGLQMTKPEGQQIVYFDGANFKAVGSVQE